MSGQPSKVGTSPDSRLPCRSTTLAPTKFTSRRSVKRGTASDKMRADCDTGIQPRASRGDAVRTEVSSAAGLSQHSRRGPSTCSPPGTPLCTPRATVAYSEAHIHPAQDTWAAQRVTHRITGKALNSSCDLVSITPPVKLFADMSSTLTTPRQTETQHDTRAHKTVATAAEHALQVGVRGQCLWQAAPQVVVRTGQRPASTRRDGDHISRHATRSQTRRRHAH
jgi:hypothetical protein